MSDAPDDRERVTLTVGERVYDYERIDAAPLGAVWWNRTRTHPVRRHEEAMLDELVRLRQRVSELEAEAKREQRLRIDAEENAYLILRSKMARTPTEEGQP